MSLVIPNAAEVRYLQYILNRTLTLKLYSNDVTPNESSTTGSFTEVTGGGYTAKTLVYGDWTFTAGDPSVAQAPIQNFNFTGSVGGGNNIYGYYVVDADNLLCWAERFPGGSVPFQPAVNTKIQITPKFQAS